DRDERAPGMRDKRAASRRARCRTRRSDQTFAAGAAGATLYGPVTTASTRRLNFHASHKPKAMIRMPRMFSKPIRNGAANETTNATMYVKTFGTSGSWIPAASAGMYVVTIDV